jgi:hypothetical protein
MSGWHTKVAACALLVLSSIAAFSQQDSKKVTVTLAK